MAKAPRRTYLPAGVTLLWLFPMFLTAITFGSMDLPRVLPLAAASISPIAILVLCVAAGIGTVLLLPSRREASIHKIGGVILLAVLLIFIAALVRYSAQVTAGEVYFWVFAIVAIVAAVRVISHARPVYSALYFVLTVLATAGLFVLAWAEFMAAALVLIYAGAILVTYVFVIMLASQSQTASSGTVESEGMADYDRTSREPLLASAVGFLLMGVMLFLVFDKSEALAQPGPAGGALAAADATTQPVLRADPDRGATLPEDASSVRSLGLYLYESQMLSLEVAAMILTLSTVGAIIIARRQAPESGMIPPEHEAPAYEVGLSATPTGVDDNPHSIPVYGTSNPRAKVYPER